MLSITRIDHISIAVSDAESEVQLLEGLFGFEATGTWNEKRDGYRGVSMAVPGRSHVGWEVLEPLRDDSFVQRFVDSPMGPGLHHVTFEVPDVAEAVEELRALGVAPWGEPPGHDEPWRECFIHPRDGNGFLYQFARAEGAHEAADRWSGEHATDDHTLGIVAINHLSHAHRDRAALAAWYERLFGMRGIYASDSTDGPFATAVLETPTGQMRWEVLQPTTPDSFVQRFLNERGPAMHHVTFEVGDWQRAIEACDYHDVPVFGQREGMTDGARWMEAFIHPRHTGGVLVQFFWEERPGVWI